MSTFGKKDSPEAKHLEEEQALKNLHGTAGVRDAQPADVLKSEASSARIGQNVLGQDRKAEPSEVYREQPESSVASSAQVRTAPGVNPLQTSGQDLIDKAHQDGIEGAEGVKETEAEVMQRNANKRKKR